MEPNLNGCADCIYLTVLQAKGSWFEVNKLEDIMFSKASNKKYLTA